MTDERGLRSGVDQITETVIAFSGGVINIVLEREKERVGSGTGFFVPGYLVTASHVLRAANFDTVVLHLSGSSGNDDVRLAADTVLASIRHESPEADHDFALLEIDQPEFESLPRFALGSTANVSPGRQVLVLGYPYDSPHLSAHVAYVSSKHVSGNSIVLQLDGSVNPSNSGGPVVDIESGEVLAYVVRAQTGLAKDFDNLLIALDRNIEVLGQQRATMSIGGIDPVAGLKVTMVAMRQLAFNMKRSANVGIGYAHAADHLTDSLRAAS